MDRIPFTQEGLERLKQELERLEKVERPQNIKAIEEARAHGDLSENAEYHAAKEKQAFIEGRINELKEIIGRSEVIDPGKEPSDRVIFGKTVILYDIEDDKEVKYRLVGPYESSPSEGRISITSPLGKALIGKEIGDDVVVQTPDGKREYEIVDIN